MNQKLLDDLMRVAANHEPPQYGGEWVLVGPQEARAILRWGGVPMPDTGAIPDFTVVTKKPEEDRVAPKMPTGAQRAEKRLREAWGDLNAEEVEKVVPKAIEYGSGDLKLMGYALKMLLNSPRARARDWSEAESMEIACVFYGLGKVARMLSAYERGDTPSDDQPHDLGVYMRMVQVLRREGAWPPGFEDYLKEDGK